ncbi:MAG: hydrolase [candidate division Zixibacteria bacterium CG_4_9_14_3_um_filter_46_8]|nr:MAG: hydrolase [candidate division Zixibacteria bacterium CG_4_9_14_3_um_filter_46_8]
MKTWLIKDIQAGDGVDSRFAVINAELNSYSKGFKLDLKLADRSGNVNAVFWDCDPKWQNKFKPGDIVHITGLAGLFQGKIQISLNDIDVVRDGYDIAQFIPSSVHNRDKMWQKLEEIISTIENQYLKALLLRFFGDEEFAELFKMIPAGKKWHHDFIGGLLQHTLYMLQVADYVAGIYAKCDRDLLLSGVMLHDIGKVYELGFPGKIDYTAKGRLEGHISIGHHLVSSAIEKIENFPEGLAMEVQHMVLSHQGERENGSPVVPLTLEAVILHLIDQLDSQVNAYSRIIDEEAREGVEWSNFIKLKERYFYFGDKYIDDNRAVD